MTAASVRTAITFIRPAATRTHGDVVLQNSGQELGGDGCKLARTHYSVARNAATCAITAFKFAGARRDVPAIAENLKIWRTERPGNASTGHLLTM